MPCGLPSWGALMAGLAEELDLPESARELASNLSHPDYADLLDSLAPSERRTLAYFEARIDDTRIRPGPHHDLVSQLAPTTVITTNWDTLIEDSFRRAAR